MSLTVAEEEERVSLSEHNGLSQGWPVVNLS
jgi:hypothetical protein